MTAEFKGRLTVDNPKKLKNISITTKTNDFSLIQYSFISNQDFWNLVTKI